MSQSILERLPNNQEVISEFVRFWERASTRQRKATLPVFGELAEAARPGARVVAALRADQKPHMALFTSELNREFKLLGQLVNAASDAKGGLILESYASLRQRVQEIIAASRLEQWVEERLKPIFNYHYKRVAESTWKLLSKQNIPTTMRDQIEAEVIAKGGKRLGLLDIEKDTHTAIFNVIREAREKGLHPRVISRMIEQYVPKGKFVNAGSRYRSLLIARTETLHAQRLSTIESYRQSPAVKECIAFDGESDEECSARNGETFTFEEAEAEAENTHPNCVLCFGPVS